MTLSVAIHTVDDLTTPVTSLAETFNKFVDLRFLEAGSAGFAIDKTNVGLSACQFKRVAMFTDSVSGQRFGMVIESQVRKVVKDENDNDRDAAVISGRLLPALLEKAVVYPYGGTGKYQPATRVFNFASPNFDASSWASAGVIAKQGTNPNSTSQYSTPYQPELLPRDWPDGDAYWMGPNVGNWEDAPDGQWPLRWTFTLASAGDYIFDFAVDNDAVLYIDGAHVASGGFGYKEMSSRSLQLSGGEHVIALKIVNGPKADNNPTAFLGSIWTDDDGERGTVVARTNSAADIAVLNSPTVSASRGTRFAIPIPGMTVGEVLDILLDEAQARDALDGWTWTFTSTVDSGLTSWPEVEELVFKVGDDYLTVLRQLAQTYIDFKVDYDDLVLHAYVKGGLGSASGVSYTSGTSVSELEVEGEG